MNILKLVINTLLPPRCIYCGQITTSEHTLCTACFQKIRFISKPYCKVCGQPFETQSELLNKMLCPDCAHQKRITRMNRAAIFYDDFSKKALLALKFSDKPENAKLFAKWMKTAGKDIFDAGVDIIVPVPLSYQRLFTRHYNQSAVLALELSKLTGVEADVFCLKKSRHTKPQSALNAKARLKNIKNAFELKHGANINGKRVLLVDDIMTTGATLAECAKVLYKEGAASVDTLTIARTLK
ncbi:MAG: ComF family protein [Alphaproteobacteria bacterium]|nr:ComF family protein [Alphaproteobacteria bacterium]